MTSNNIASFDALNRVFFLFKKPSKKRKIFEGFFCGLNYFWEYSVFSGDFRNKNIQESFKKKIYLSDPRTQNEGSGPPGPPPTYGGAIIYQGKRQPRRKLGARLAGGREFSLPVSFFDTQDRSRAAFMYPYLTIHPRTKAPILSPLPTWSNQI